MKFAEEESHIIVVDHIYYWPLLFIAMVYSNGHLGFPITCSIKTRHT